MSNNEITAIIMEYYKTIAHIDQLKNDIKWHRKEIEKIEKTINQLHAQLEPSKKIVIDYFKAKESDPTK